MIVMIIHTNIPAQRSQTNKWLPGSRQAGHSQPFIIIIIRGEERCEPLSSQAVWGNKTTRVKSGDINNWAKINRTSNA